MDYIFTKMKKGTPDYYFLAAVIILMAVGLLVVYSSSSTVAFYEYDTPSYFIKKQIIKLIFCVALMVILIKIDYNIFRNLAPVFLIISFIMLITLLLGFNSVETKGATRWFSFPYFNFQPSELMKFSLIIYVAALIEKKGTKIRDFKNGFLPPLIVIISTISLIFLQPDFSTCVLISVIVFLLLFLGGAKIIHLIAGSGILIGLFLVQLLIHPYQLKRITSYLNPEAPGLNQVGQSLIAIGNGGLFGQGLGASQSKNLFVPEPFTDFIFAIFSEEWGFIGVFIVLLLFLFILYRGLKISVDAPDKFGKLVAAGITFSIVFFGFINAGVVCRLIPATGLPMPFISYGGSSLLFCSTSVGILLNISKTRTMDEKSKVVFNKNRKIRK